MNWCLKQVGASNWNSKASQGAISSSNMKKIETPVYGAIIIMKNYIASTGKGIDTGHSTFLVGETKDGKSYIGLGGNQNNMLKLSKYRKTGISYTFTDKNGIKYNQKFYGLYLPKEYTIKEIDKLTENDIYSNDLVKVDTTTR